MTPSLIISLLLGASLCRALPGSLQNHRILTSSDNPFDGGAVESCEIPTTELCTGIDYTVPTSIARLAAIIEDEIRSKLSDLGRNNSCRPVVEELMCSMRFPRCQRREGSQEMEVVINHQNCSRVLSVCSAEIAEHVHGMCTGLTQTTVSVGGCRPISNHTLPENFNFEQCSLEETTLVTEWMLEYLKYAEQHTTRSFLYTSSQSVCGQKLASYQCQFLGRCTPDGQRVEFINTHESCNDAVNCFSHTNQEYALRETSCPLWPQAHLRNIGTSSSTTTERATTSSPAPQSTLDPLAQSGSTWTLPSGSFTLPFSVTSAAAALSSMGHFSAILTQLFFFITSL